MLLLGLSLYILLPTLFLFLLCFRIGFPALTLSFIWFPLYLRALLWCFWALLLHCYLFVLFSTACSLRKQLKIQALALMLLLEILVYICNNYSIHSKTKQTDLISSSFLPQDWTLEVICHQPKSECNLVFTCFSSSVCRRYSFKHSWFLKTKIQRSVCA